MRGKPVPFSGLNGGVNAVDSPYFLEDNEARDARNFVPSLRGKIRKRDGAQTFKRLSAQFDSLFAMQTPSPFLVLARAGEIGTLDPAAVFVQRAFPAAGQWEWVQAPASGGQGPLFGMNAQDVPLQWDGAALNFANWTASVGTLPNGRFIVYAGSRVFVAGMAAYGAVDDPGSTLVFSNLANPRDWPAENVVEFDPRDGDRITGIGTVGPYLLVFKSKKAWVVYDLDTGANRRLGENVGCIAHRSIVETARGTYFLTDDQGVCLTDGSTVKHVSDRVKPLLDKLQAGQRQNVAAVAHADHYYASLSTAGAVNDLTLDHDMLTDSWWPHDSIAEQDFAVWDPSGNGPALYGLKASDLVVHELFTPGLRQDDGANFTAYWKGPFHTFGAPNLNKRVRQIVLEGRGKGTVKIARSYSTDEETLGAEDFATDSGLISIGEARIFTPGVGRAFSLVVVGDTADELELDSYTFAIQARRN